MRKHNYDPQDGQPDNIDDYRSPSWSIPADVPEQRSNFKPRQRVVAGISAAALVLATGGYFAWRELFKGVGQPQTVATASAHRDGKAQNISRQQSVLENGVINLADVPTTVPKAVAADAASVVTVVSYSAVHRNAQRQFVGKAHYATGYAVQLPGSNDSALEVMTAAHELSNGGSSNSKIDTRFTVVNGNAGGQPTEAPISGVQVPPEFSEVDNYDLGANVDEALLRVNTSDSTVPGGFDSTASLRIASDNELAQVKPGTVVFELGMALLNGSGVAMSPHGADIIEGVVYSRGASGGNQFDFIPVKNLTYPNEQPSILPGDSGAVLALSNGFVIGTESTSQGVFPESDMPLSGPRIIGGQASMVELATATWDDPANLAVLTGASYHRVSNPLFN